MSSQFHEDWSRFAWKPILGFSKLGFSAKVESKSPSDHRMSQGSEGSNPSSNRVKTLSCRRVKRNGCN